MSRSAYTARQWLETLVGFDTTSAKTNIPLIDHVSEYLAAVGVPRLTVTRSEDGTHANLLATLPAADGTSVGGFILSGHSDVVPVEGQPWTTDPFTLVERDGNLYGRGSCDMKGFLAICLSLVPEWLATPRRRALHLVLTYDEETSFRGIRQLMRECGEDIAACEGCIVGEPTMMDIIVAHKGISGSIVTCTGHAAHSSLQTSGCNAIESASRVLRFLFDLRDRFATQGPYTEGFAIPYTTLCPTIVHGGIATNTIPEECVVNFEFRNVPSHSAQSILNDVSTFVHSEHANVSQGPFPEAAVTLRTLTLIAAFEGDPQSTVFQALQNASEEPREPVKVCFCTEAGEYQQLGVPTVVCGPGSIDQAHRVDEFISIEQLEKGVRVIRRAVAQLCE